MAGAGTREESARPGAAADPAAPPRRWPWALIVALALAGLISPAICLIAATIAYALADPEQGTLLAALGLAHALLGLTLAIGP